MKIISIRFGKGAKVAALTEVLKEYADQICIAYKPTSIGSVKVITHSKEVVDFLFEINPNCSELANVPDFIKNELHGHTVTNPELLKFYPGYNENN